MADQIYQFFELDLLDLTCMPCFTVITCLWRLCTDFGYTRGSCIMTNQILEDGDLGGTDICNLHDDSTTWLRFFLSKTAVIANIMSLPSLRAVGASVSMKLHLINSSDNKSPPVYYSLCICGRETFGISFQSN